MYTLAHLILIMIEIRAGFDMLQFEGTLGVSETKNRLMVAFDSPGGQIWNQCKWRHVVTKFEIKNISSGTTDPGWNCS